MPEINQQELQLEADLLFASVNIIRRHTNDDAQLQDFTRKFQQLLITLKNKPELLSCKMYLNYKMPFLLGVYYSLNVLFDENLNNTIKKLLAVFILQFFEDDALSSHLQLQELDQRSISILIDILFPIALVASENADNVIIKRIDTLPVPQSEKFYKEIYDITTTFIDNNKQSSRIRDLTLKRMISFNNYIRMWERCEIATANPNRKQLVHVVKPPSNQKKFTSHNFPTHQGITESSLIIFENSIDELWQLELNANFPFTEEYLNDLRDRLFFLHYRNPKLAKIPASEISKYFIAEYNDETSLLNDKEFKIMTNMIFIFGLELAEPNCLRLIIKDAIEQICKNELSNADNWQNYFTLAFDSLKLLKESNAHVEELNLLTKILQDKYSIAVDGSSTSNIKFALLQSPSALEVYTTMDIFYNGSREPMLFNTSSDISSHTNHPMTFKLSLTDDRVECRSCCVIS